MDTVCMSCGAPARPGVIECEFCERPVSAEAARNAVGCKQCRTLNVEHAQQCIKCKSWLVVQCLFCSQLSRHDAPGCMSCREPFLGAAERKAARDAPLRNQQIMNVAVPIAGSLLGGVAGAFLGGSAASSYSHRHHPSSSSPNEHHHSMGNSVWNNDSDSSTSSVGESVREMFSDDSSSNEGSVLDSIADSFSADDDNERG